MSPCVSSTTRKMPQNPGCSVVLMYCSTCLPLCAKAGFTRTLQGCVRSIIPIRRSGKSQQLLAGFVHATVYLHSWLLRSERFSMYQILFSLPSCHSTSSITAINRVFSMYKAGMKQQQREGDATLQAAVLIPSACVHLALCCKACHCGAACGTQAAAHFIHWVFQSLQ